MSYLLSPSPLFSPFLSAIYSQTAVSVVKTGFALIKNPSTTGKHSKYRPVRITVDSADHVRLKTFPSESALQSASKQPNATTPSMDDVKDDEPMSIRYCTMSSLGTSVSVLVQTANPGYVSTDSGYIAPMLTVRKIKFKFDGHDTAVDWANFLNQRVGADKGYPHVDTAVLTGKIMTGAIQKFSRQQMGSQSTAQPASPSKEAMANLVMHHVYKEAIIPTVQAETMPIINKPWPNFVKQRSFKAVSGLFHPRVEARVAQAFHVCEMLVQELAGYVERFIEQLVAWVMEHIVQPVIDKIRARQAQQAEEKTDEHEPSIKQRIITKAKELSAHIPFAALFARLRSLLSAANISLSQPSSVGFSEQHYESMASNEVESLLMQAERNALHR